MTSIDRKDATQHTIFLNQKATTPTDAKDFERVSRGFVAHHPTGIISDHDGRTVVDVNQYNFLETGNPAPNTVHPSLWRHAQLNHHHGLFEVTPGIWQVRGYDLSNITFIQGDTGWIIVDPLTTQQTARDALALANAHLGPRPVLAVIYTHSHTDHFGGVLGVTSQEEVDAGRCMVIAPEHFLEETVGENVIAGPAMARRALFQFGVLLPADPKAHVDCGLGNGLPLGGPDLIAPTHDITRTGEEMTIDGVHVVFQLTPETEAPAEMNFYFPQFRALCMAENCSHTMHNLIPIRGALVRNALKWSKYIHEAMTLFADQTDILFTSHNWPQWGQTEVRDFLTNQRDLYKWMHDQAMRLANHGYVPTEISDQLALPEEFLANDHTRGYYGDLVHNAKAVYQRYLSWYDGNPANLHRLPPEDAGRRYVALAGGEDNLLTQARSAFDQGEYRWVAELLNHLIFANPGNQAARLLQADTMEQLGYQAESSTFRNAYLNAAQELRQGPPPIAGKPVRARGILRAMTVEQIFDAMSIRLQSEALGGIKTELNVTVNDLRTHWVIGISNRTLYYQAAPASTSAQAHISLSRETLIDVMSGERLIGEAVNDGLVKVDGPIEPVEQTFGHLDTFMSGFNVIEP
jgi:alkyl sulfatase BDS1-like metallo-beta-lactamase superfamily hydrolase